MIAIDASKCNACGLCILDCQPGSIIIEDGKAIPKPGSRCLECGHCVAICPTDAVRVVGYDENDILTYQQEKFDISPEKLLNFARFRRSTRLYTDEAVSEDDIKSIVEMARFTATGANSQMLRFIVLSGDMKKQFAKQAIKFLAEFDVTSVDFSDIRLPKSYGNYQPVWKAWNRISNATGQDMLLHDSPCMMLVVSYKSNEIDSALSLANMQLMIQSLNLGSCSTGFGTLAFALNPEFRDMVGLSQDEVVTFSMTFGHPKYPYHRTTERKPVKYTVLK